MNFSEFQFTNSFIFNYLILLDLSDDLCFFVFFKPEI